MKALAAWLGRTALLYGALLVAVAFALLVLPRLLDGWKDGSLQREVASPAEVRAEIEAMRDQAQAGLERRTSEIRTLPSEAIAAQLSARRQALSDARSELRARGGLFDAIRPSRIIARKRLELRVLVLEREVAALELAANARAAEAQAGAIGPRMPTERAVAAARQLCWTAQARSAAFARLPELERQSRQVILGERTRLTTQQRTACARADTVDRQRRAGLAAREAMQRARDAMAELDRARVDPLPETLADDVSEINLRRIMGLAAWALLGILLAPYAIRTLFYYGLAPLAQRRGAIRLAVPGGRGEPFAVGGRSAISLPVRLDGGEVLLVRQGYLQTTSLSGRKATQWLLDWRHPLSSLASGMAFLTRIEGAGEATTVSAVRDPLAEVAEIALPAGAACVLHPRGLAAVVHPSGQPLRVTSHWRLFTLSAWLTLQLRYLAFHGPARLVVKGGRGVRVERAEQGRVFGQDQLVGFSADLSYSVTRNETFMPYLLGREPLFRDKVEEGEGVLIIEEAPLAGRRGGTARGLEGTLDTMLKAVGL